MSASSTTEPPDGSAPLSLADFRDRHAGESIVVCGCGRSLTADVAQAGLTTIGVNDVGRLFTPNYLVVVNPPRQFRHGRFEHVRHSQAQAVFSQLDLGELHAPQVRFRLGRHGGTDIGAEAVLHHTQNSPYVAVCLAAWMGARRIGLIGVDFSEDHFFARTGRHALSGRLSRIDSEYTALAEGLKAQGIELVNLSPISRLQGLPRMSLQEFGGQTPSSPGCGRAQRVFFVHHRFLTCGEVFHDGLRHAARSLGLAHAEADCLDPRLPEKVAAFAPDLLLVVHGRRFVQRWGDRFTSWAPASHSAVWLVDEPYEVDDTSRWSHHFDTVFVNDPVTLARHHPRSGGVHHLPMAFDPVHCHAPSDASPRRHRVGFIGGANPTRERMLLPLAQAGLLSYVVGGPWRSPLLRRLTLAPRIPHERTAALYRQTDIVINVFRDRHHFNAEGLREGAPGPRVFEALACGALVVSEAREGVCDTFPELPTFEDDAGLLSQVERLLADPEARQQALQACQVRLSAHRYADRLAQALALTGQTPAEREPLASPAPAAEATHAEPVAAPAPALRHPQAHRSAHPPAHQPAHPSAHTQALTLPPLVAAPRRHLMYHLWPVRGETWRWNVAQLLQRIELFNGRRLVSIVVDDRTEDLAEVQAAFAGHGVEFFVRPNADGGESLTFPIMLAELARERPEDLSFYAHAKGVKYEPDFPPAVKRWAEAQYTVTLDHWPTVRAHLERHAMTGMLRRVGRFANHHHVGDWHYSGTFFWFRHDAVFSRRWQDVPAFYGGVEAWPGMMFSRQETSCLLLDQLRELPYRDRFWAHRGTPALRQWLRHQKAPTPPADLLKPLAFEGHAHPRLEQRPTEFTAWLRQLLADRPRHLLLIGPRQEGVAWHVQRHAEASGQRMQVWQLPAGADSSASELAAMPTQVDAVFIDGVPGHAGCQRNVELAERLGARHIALHDIVDSDWHAASGCCVSRVWGELAARHPCQLTTHVDGGEWGGIGVLRLPPLLALKPEPKPDPGPPAGHRCARCPPTGEPCPHPHPLSAAQPA